MDERERTQRPARPSDNGDGSALEDNWFRCFLKFVTCPAVESKWNDLDSFSFSISSFLLNIHYKTLKAETVPRYTQHNSLQCESTFNIRHIRHTSSYIKINKLPADIAIQAAASSHQYPGLVILSKGVLLSLERQSNHHWRLWEALVT